MEKIDTKSIASEDEIKRLIGNFMNTKDIMREARYWIKNGFKDLEEEQEALIRPSYMLPGTPLHR